MEAKPPRVVISGYYGFSNLGDEAVLLAMLNSLQKSWRERNGGRRVADLQIVVLSNDSARTRKTYGVEAVNRWQLKEIYRVVRDADLFISGGGSLLQDVTGLKSLLYYLGVVWLAMQLKKPVVFYAQGIGPVRTGIGQFLVRKIANRARLIIVRDEQSAKDLARMGIVKPPVYVTVDAALGLPCGSIGAGFGRKILKHYGAVAEKTAGISVRSWPGFGKKKRQAVARMADGLKRLGWQVVFLPFHYPDDVAVCRDVAAMMAAPAPVLDRGFSVEEMVSVIKCLDLLIGMRLHALILAAILNVPLVGISYDPKIERFLKQLSLQPAAEVGNLDFGRLKRAVDEVLGDLEGFGQRLAEKVTPLQHLADKTAALTLDVLEDC
ncbi:MAG: polysaccharide pyruvyl transferase CsaB [Firmicutes bacterium]|nr:polysaccharide pyruvyl transferase CsaB [Bacillota bacterium]